MTQDLEEKCSDDDKECQKRADFMKNDDQETESDTIESSNEMKLEYELEEENAEGDAVEEEDDDNEEEEEEGSGEEEDEEEEIEEGDDDPNLDEETSEEDPSYEDETEDEDQDDDGASQEGVPLDDNYEDDNGTSTTLNATMPSQNVSSAISPREFVPVAKPVPPMKGTVFQSSRISPIITPKGKTHQHSKVIVNRRVANPIALRTVNGIPAPAVSNPVIPLAKVQRVAFRREPVIPLAKVQRATFRREQIVTNPIPPPLNIPPIIPPSPPHMHFGQRFGGYYADGGLMGPGNWQARNWFSIGTLRKDGVRLNGACCGNTCRNGGRIGCCGKCPNCLDCPY